LKARRKNPHKVRKNLPAGVPGAASDQSDRPSFKAVEMLYGRYIRLYIKPASADLEAPLTVHCGDFLIREGDSELKAHVEQTNFEHDLKLFEQKLTSFHEKRPFGYLKVTLDTIEMVLKYGENMPDSYFLGRFPIAGQIDAFLLVNLDIKFDSRDISAQPMLFIRIGDNDAIPRGPHGLSTKLFRTLKKYFGECISYDERLFELVPSGASRASQKKVIDALNELRVGALFSIQ
jgi:hypothetical protein